MKRMEGNSQSRPAADLKCGSHVHNSIEIRRDQHATVDAASTPVASVDATSTLPGRASTAQPTHQHVERRPYTTTPARRSAIELLRSTRMVGFQRLMRIFAQRASFREAIVRVRWVRAISGSRLSRSQPASLMNPRKPGLTGGTLRRGRRGAIASLRRRPLRERRPTSG